MRAGTTSVLLAVVKHMPGPLPEKQSVLNKRVLGDEETDERMKSTTKQNLRNRSGVSQLNYATIFSFLFFTVYKCQILQN